MISQRKLTIATLASACALLQVASISAAERISVDAESVIAYIESCRKENGAFGPADQEYTDAAWNYPAVHTLRLLGTNVASPDQVLANGLGYPKGHAGYGHWLVYHQAMIRWLLSDPAEGRKAPSEVHLKHQGFEIRYYGSPFGTGGDHFFKTGGQSAAKQFRESRELGYYNLSSLFYLLSALHADGRKPANRDEVVAFILKRQAPSGGFVDVRTSGGQPHDGEMHIAHTFHAVASLRLLNEPVPHPDRCVDYAQRCQVRNITPQPGTAFAGGFRFDPDADRPGNYPDAYYTYAALQVLHLLDGELASVDDCRDWLLSLQNYDGGFGDRPGWRSRLYSTYYAVHSLALLSAGPVNSDGNRLSTITTAHLENARSIVPSRQLIAPRADKPIDPSLKIYQGLFKTPVVTPEDFAGLQQRGFSLFAMKTDDFTLVRSLRRSADDHEMSVILCPEAYPHRLKRSGGAVLHHVGNFTLDPDWTESQRATWTTADAAGQLGLQWNEYQQRVLTPMRQLGSLCYPEQDFEYEFALSAYDDGVYGRSGYNAIQVGFNWSPRDFVRVFPWRERYTDKLPAVADADSHGDLTEWSPQLDHTRHLYIARRGSYDDFLDAARNGRVVCVVTGVEGVKSGVSFYGRPNAVEFVKARQLEWKWWNGE